MSQDTPYSSTGAGGAPAGASGTGSTGGSTTDAAKEQASNLKDRATDAGGHLAGDAKGEAQAVTHEAKRQLGDLWSQARDEVTSQAGSQQSRLAGGLSTAGRQLDEMASSSSEQGIATDVVREVAGRVSAVGEWLEHHGPDEALEEVRRFARRRPGTFLVIAAGAGILAGRLTRGLKDSSSEPQGQATGVRSTPAATPVVERTPAYTETLQERPAVSDPLAAPVPSTPGWEPR